MKTITIDVIKGTADVHAVEGDVGVKVTITNTPQEWKNCTVFALLTQGSKSQHIKVIDNTFEIPSAFTDANKAFKFGVYAVGANASRDVRPSIWIRVADSDFTTEDIEITSKTIDDILMLQSQYTKYKNAEEDRAEAEKLRQANESARIEAENNRKTELTDVKTRLSYAETDIDNLEDGKVDKVSGYGLANVYIGTDKNAISILKEDGHSYTFQYYNNNYIDSSLVKKVDKIYGKDLSTNDYTDHDAKKLAGIEYGAQANLPVDQTYKSKSANAQSGKAVAEAIAKLVNGSPGVLDTLYELANALGNNPNFATAVMDEIGKKVDKIDGKGLSEKDFTEAYKARLDRVYTEDGGGGIGRGVSVDIGGAVGSGAQSYSGGGAIGAGTIAGLGLAGGYHARTADENDVAIDAIQLGTGQNTQPKTLQIYDYTLMNADGTIPAERMAVTPITEIPATLSPNQTYHFSESPASIAFPSADVADGDTIYLTFMTGDTPPTIEFYTTNTTDIDIVIEANTGYEIYGKYVANIGKWIVGYSEYTVTDGEAV